MIARDCCVRFPLPHSTLKAQGFHGPKRKKHGKGCNQRNVNSQVGCFLPRVRLNPGNLIQLAKRCFRPHGTGSRASKKSLWTVILIWGLLFLREWLFGESIHHPRVVLLLKRCPTLVQLGHDKLDLGFHPYSGRCSMSN